MLGWRNSAGRVVFGEKWIVKVCCLAPKNQNLEGSNQYKRRVGHALGGDG